MPSKLLLFFISLLAGRCCISQTLNPPSDYHLHIANADSLSGLKEYEAAGKEMALAFEAFDGRATPGDRYKAARIYTLAGNYDSAMLNLERLARQQFVNHLKISGDPTFVQLRQSNPRRFDSSLQLIRRNKEKLAPDQNLEWTNFLEDIYSEDQVLRGRFQKIALAKGWNAPEAQALLPGMKIKDSLNLIAITTFIDNHGWQGPAIVGEKGNSTLFLVIQHADSSTQQKYLPVLRQAVIEKKAKPSQLALLEDRVLVDKYGYQVYGSQVYNDSVTNKMTFFPIKDEMDVDRRRKEMGLQPIAEYARIFGIEYIPPKK